MKLAYITCSGANEYTDLEDLFALHAEFPQMEFGIQVSSKKCHYGSARMEWLQYFARELTYSLDNIPVALHLNQDWVVKFTQGELVPELEELLSYYKLDGDPVFGRIQLNFKIGREPQPDISVLETMIGCYTDYKFILSYSENNAEFIQELYRRGRCQFDCLYDDSFGEGIAPQTRKKPAFHDVLQGYAGGLSPDNITEELTKIAKVLPSSASFFIDAEGKLKGENGHLSIEKCRRFAANALKWEAENL